MIECCRRRNHRYKAHHQAEHMHGNSVYHKMKWQRMGLVVPEAALRETAVKCVEQEPTQPQAGLVLVQQKTLRENYY